LIACIFVPLFPLAARLRSEPELKEEAVVICEGNGAAARVSSATRKARKVGIEPGMTLPQARARLPKLIARGRDASCERTAQQTLLEVAESFSPRVEDAGEGVVYLDLEGHPALARSPGGGKPRPYDSSAVGAALGCRRPSDDASYCRGSSVGGRTAAARDEAHRLLARDLLRAVEKAGLPGRVGVAASKLSARVAAGLPESPTVVPEGEEQSFLAPLPLSRLAPEWETAATLERWGLRTIGDFANLPEGEVASRLGEGGRDLHASARGIDPRPLEPYLPPPSFSEGMELEWPLASLEPFLFVAHAALTRLVERLESHALACTRLETVLTLDPDGHDARAIQLPAPTRDVKTLLTLLRLDLEARPPGAAVAGFTFSAHPDQPRRAQLSLFGPAALSPDRLATTIARLAALLGADRVGSPRALDGHRPERFTATGYAAPPPPPMRLPPRAGRGLLSVRVLRPPVPLEVIVGEGGVSDLHLLSLKSPPDAAPSIAGSVRVAAGPWSLEEGWWTDSAADRDYWDVELSDGGLYRIYRARSGGAWFADGVYD
jgi:protein ImuB